MNQNLTKAVSRKLKYYMEVKRLEDGFDLNYNNDFNNYSNQFGGKNDFYGADPMIMRGTPANIEKEEEVKVMTLVLRIIFTEKSLIVLSFSSNSKTSKFLSICLSLIRYG